MATISHAVVHDPHASSKQHGAWDVSVAKGFHEFDEKLAEAIVSMFPDAPKSAADFGCGPGIYCKYFFDHGWNHVYGYEGTPNVWGIFDHIIPIDLAIQHNFSKFELVLSLEVGEHLPPQFEDVFVENLNSATSKFLILSWATVGQGGVGHVNERPAGYIIEKMTKKGFTLNQDKTNILRESSTLPWFKNTLFFFERI